MAHPTWLDRVAAVLGATAEARALSGGAWLVAGGGRSVVAKLGPGYVDEAEGLRRLGQVDGGPPVPEVLLAEDDLLVTVAVDQEPRSRGHDEDLGRSLGMLHRAPWPVWGGGSGSVGACRVDPAVHPSGTAFYAARLRELASRCALADVVDPVAARLHELLPTDGPALVHGDLWWGNVLFGAGGRSWLIDPSVHGGHPEEDLAMLALFGPVPDALLAAYCEVRPPAEGWRQRVALFQLYPLLVHTVLFGGGYRSRAEEVARRYA